MWFQNILKLFLIVICFWTEVGYCQNMPPASVSVAQVEEKDISKTIELVGEILPARIAVINPDIAGKVQEVLFKESQHVKQNDVLIKLDSSATQLELNMKLSQIEELKLEIAEKENYLARRDPLYTKGLLSEEEQYSKTQALKILNQKRNTLEANLAWLQDKMDKHLVRAPFDGVILSKLCESGEWVGLETSICELAQINEVHASFTLPENYYNSINKEAPVSVIANALPENNFSGNLYALIPNSLKSGKSMPIKIRLENKENLLSPGMYCRGLITLAGTQKALLVPKDAITFQGEMKTVFVVEDNMAKQVSVEVISSYGDQVIIKGGVYSGQKVVIEGNERIRSGQNVTVINS